MGKRKGRRPNATGRNDTPDQYAPLTYAMLKSEAWRTLSGPAAKVWLEVRSRYNGSNNGKLSLSLDEAAGLLRLGKATVMRAFAELQTHGLLALTERGQWYGRKASRWRVTDKSCDGHLATNDWRQWREAKKQSLGSVSDPQRYATGPLENRPNESWSAAEPVGRA